ncbi:MAG: PSD1 and planctomycete cytochrome C domain-containing protein [Verrucomicrobiales bacterium]
MNPEHRNGLEAKDAPAKGACRTEQFRLGRASRWCALLRGAAVVAIWQSAALAGPSEEVEFNRDVRPILSENCLHCHGPDANERKADLRLDVRDESALAVLSPGDVHASELVHRVSTDDPDDRMPPAKSNRSLDDEQRDILRRWVEQGADYQKHWAFIKPERPESPAVSDTEWPRNAIDRFVLARLDEEGLAPSPEAERHTLARRLYLDLTGLPPTAEEVEAFANDESGDAVDRLVDRLLDSPHYGERMALPWLDASRYADSNGFQQDGDRHQYIWRDWVVKAINENMAFDRFTLWQLAGDLLEEPSREQLVATGFNRNHMLNGEGGAIAEEQRNNYVFDRVDTTATTWLGLTLACAQCHDHKFDPLSQVDYYRFFAYFNNLPETGRVDTRMGRIQYAEPSLSLASPEQEARRKELGQAVSARQKVLNQDKEAIDEAVVAWWDAGADPEKLPEKLRPLVDRPYEAVVPAEQRLIREIWIKQSDREEWRTAQVEKEKLEGQLAKLRREIPVVMIMEEQEEVRPSFVLDRGDYESPGERVTPGVPETLRGPADELPANRLGLARWLVDEENPLTARVTVNRYWQLFFGTGLVKTSEDFGVQGEAPSHPDLLDWLAVEFRESGWDVKHLHRLIATSATYRQSSRLRDGLGERDPENRLLARASRFRLPSMALRDQALALSGLLVEKIGGPPVYPYQPPGLWEEFSYDKFSYTPDEGEKLYRRSLYTFWRRTLGPTNLFDAANRQICEVRPKLTNTPLHALTTLNDPTYVEAARVWAERMLKEGGDAPLAWAFRQATGRPPGEREGEALRRMYEKARSHYAGSPGAAEKFLAVGERSRDEALDAVELASFATVGQLLLNSDEVLTRE